MTGRAGRMLSRIRLPHMITPCSHCGNPAGFWVSAKGHETVRRPWCLTCTGHLDRDRFDVTRFRP